MEGHISHEKENEIGEKRDGVIKKTKMTKRERERERVCVCVSFFPLTLHEVIFFMFFLSIIPYCPGVTQ